jgi:hypothetical protein
MEHLSRPYQIALVALVVAAAAWFLAFGHHSSSGSGSSSGSQSSATASTPAKPSAPASSANPSNPSAGAGSSHVYHGSAPGVEGLTRDIAKAHGAAATSQGYNNKLEESSKHASGEASPATPSQSPGSAASQAPSGASKAPAGSATATTHPASGVQSGSHPSSSGAAAPKHPAGTTSHALGTPAGQKAVEADVAGGKVALLLFWNPAGSADVAVRGQVQAVKGSHFPLVVYEGSARTVASFGAITRQIPVYGTPTILVIGAKGRTSSLTGLQDTYTIEAAIREVR